MTTTSTTVVARPKITTLPTVLRAGRFQPFSATFISATTAFVLGGSRCAPSYSIICDAELLRSGDRGGSWQSVHIPALTVGDNGHEDLDGVRFADARDGYLFGQRLWTTHDGGAHWQPVPLVNGRQDCTRIDALEIGTGVVHVVTTADCGSATVHFVLETSGLREDRFAAAALSLPVGNGGGGGPQLVVRGSRAWLLDVNRGLLGAGRYSNGAWRPWPTAPCKTAKGNGYPEISIDLSGSELAADCFTYAEGPAAAVSHFVSTDAGTTFHRSLRSLGSLVPMPPFEVAYGENGFTTATQGYAIAGVPPHDIHALYLTTDAGRTWRPIAFTTP